MWETLPHAKFCKNCLRGYTPVGQIYTKSYQFLQFWCCFGSPGCVCIFVPSLGGLYNCVGSVWFVKKSGGGSFLTKAHGSKSEGWDFWYGSASPIPTSYGVWVSTVMSRSRIPGQTVDIQTDTGENNTTYHCMGGTKICKAQVCSQSQFAEGGSDLINT